MIFVMGGCAIHPLPENIGSLDTKAIVRKIRCEARGALQEQVRGIIERDPKATIEIKRKWINFLYSNVRQFAKMNPNELDRSTIGYMDKYQYYLIYFDFTFTIYEENNVSADLNLLSTLTRGTDALNLKANNRKRQNLRNFRIRNTFKDILDDVDCDQFTHHPDYMYPITGQIGLHEVIDTFLNLNESKTLSPKKPKDDVELFADTLSFTTLISGSAGPKIVLSPIGKPLSLADAGLTATATRSDTHEVIVGMSLPSETSESNVPPARIIPASPYDPVRTSKGYREEQLDFFVDQQIRRNLLLNLGATRGAAVSLFPNF